MPARIQSLPTAPRRNVRAMNVTDAHRPPAIEWCVASRAAPEEAESGDLHLVSQWEGGALVAVIDGLGHGPQATVAARQAAEVLEGRAREPLVALMNHCHGAIRETRGAVMTLVAFDSRDEPATALGVGNVEAVLFRAHRQVQPPRELILLRAGVVGYQLPALQTSVFPIVAGDVTVFATDGVLEDFAERVHPGEALPTLVERILERDFRGTDDGLVLACKYTGAR